MAVKIKYLGHSAFLITAKNGVVVAVDPFISGNPNAPITVKDVNCDVVAITHGHRDHLGDGIEIAKRNNATLVAIFEVTQYAIANGIEDTVAMNFGGTVDIKGVKFTLVPAMHSGGIVTEAGIIYGGFSGGFIIDAGVRIYHAGDTALFSDMKLIGELYKPEVALLPIGDTFTMGPKEAAIAVYWLQPKIVIPMHYKTFPVILQDVGPFLNELNKIKSQKGFEVEVLALKAGEEMEL